MKYNIEGLDELREKLNGLDGASLEGALAGVNQAAAMMAGEARARVQPISTEVMNAITWEAYDISGAVHGRVLVNKEYAIFLEMGTGPRGEMTHDGVSPNALANVTYRDKFWIYTIPEDEMKSSGGKLPPDSLPKDEVLALFDGQYWIKTFGLPARPYMYPAYQITKERAQEMIKASILAAITEAVHGNH